MNQLLFSSVNLTFHSVCSISSSFPGPMSHDECTYKHGNETHILYVEVSNLYTSSLFESHTPKVLSFCSPRSQVHTHTYTHTHTLLSMQFDPVRDCMTIATDHAVA